MANDETGKVLEFIPDKGLRSLLRKGIDLEELEWRLKWPHARWDTKKPKDGEA